MNQSIHATFRISIMLLREPAGAVGLPTALCRLEPTKYALVKAALALNLRAGSYINIFYCQQGRAGYYFKKFLAIGIKFWCNVVYSDSSPLGKRHFVVGKRSYAWPVCFVGCPQYSENAEDFVNFRVP
jgi:hypothetical protein